jgi:Resolvase, N terminal domain
MWRRSGSGSRSGVAFTVFCRASAALKAMEQPIDISTAAGKCSLDMLGVFAEFETYLRRERQLEGIAKAKAAGVYYKGCPASIDAARVRELKAQGMSLSLERRFDGRRVLALGNRALKIGRKPREPTQLDRSRLDYDYLAMVLFGGVYPNPRSVHVTRCVDCHHGVPLKRRSGRARGGARSMCIGCPKIMRRGDP